MKVLIKGYILNEIFDRSPTGHIYFKVVADIRIYAILMSECRGMWEDLGGHFEYSHFIEITAGDYRVPTWIKCFAYFPGIFELER